MVTHQHHIIPKHMGGTDNPENLVSLTIEEHAEAHRLLWEQHGKLQDKLAWLMLSGKTEEAEVCRIELARQPKSEAHKAKIAEALVGNTNGLGLTRPPYSEEHKRKIAEAQRKRLASEEGHARHMLGIEKRSENAEWVENFKKVNVGRKHTDEHNQKIAQTLTGKTRGPYKISEKSRPPRTEEHKRKLSEARKKNWNDGVYANRKRKASEVV